MAYHPTRLRVLGTGSIPVRGRALVARGGRSREYETKPVYPRALITEIGPGMSSGPPLSACQNFAALSRQMQENDLVRGHATLEKSSADPILAARCAGDGDDRQGNGAVIAIAPRGAALCYFGRDCSSHSRPCS